MPNLKRKRGDHNGSDDDEPSFGKQILPVANLPDTFDGIPSDGMEYLFTVRRDAFLLPHITRVENPYQTEEPVLPPPRSLEVTHPSIPSAEWRSLFEIRFRNLRKNVVQPTDTAASSSKIRMPDKQERSAWWEFLAGKPESVWNPPKKPKALKQKKYGWGMRAFDDDNAHLDYNASAREDGQVASSSSEIRSAHSDKARDDSPPLCNPVLPTSLLLGQMDERMALHLLMYFTYWINQHLQEDRQPPFPRPTQAHLQWIFALLTRVEEHVSADDMNLLRNLTRACIALLKAMILEQGSRSEMEEKDNDNENGQASCWMIISVVIAMWGQRDLWIDAEDMLQSIKRA